MSSQFDTFNVRGIFLCIHILQFLPYTWHSFDMCYCLLEIDIDGNIGTLRTCKSV